MLTSSRNPLPIVLFRCTQSPPRNVDEEPHGTSGPAAHSRARHRLLDETVADLILRALPSDRSWDLASRVGSGLPVAFSLCEMGVMTSRLKRSCDPHNTSPDELGAIDTYLPPLL